MEQNSDTSDESAAGQNFDASNFDTSDEFHEDAMGQNSDDYDYHDDYDGNEAFPHFLPTGCTSVRGQGVPVVYRPLSLCRPAPADRLSGG